VVKLGWSVSGVDVPEDQLPLARQRGGERVELAQADATDPPFPDASFNTVLSAFPHTDVDDFKGLVREANAARAPLRRGARRQGPS
jgi:ubiquinone/menaquinone biosynthesis C-methylase UbiE